MFKLNSFCDTFKLFYTEDWSSSFKKFNYSRSVDLDVRKISVDEYPQVSRLMGIWESVSHEKEAQSTDSLDQKKFRDCAEVAESLISDVFQDADLSGRVFYNPFTKSYLKILSEVIVCENPKDASIQGVMSYNIVPEENLLYVEYLVSNPNNIVSSKDKFDFTKIRGVGTKLLDEAVEMAYEHGFSEIKLHPTVTSKDFYRNYGFVPHAKERDKLTLNVNEIMMKRIAELEPPLVA